jgi:mevalonate pyrophosphate decarboxylase
MNTFERFVKRVEKNAMSYTKEQWEKNDEQLKKYVNQYDKVKQKLSSDEKMKVGELTVRYYKARVKAKGLNILGEIDGWLEYLKGFGDEILKDVDNYQNQ